MVMSGSPDDPRDNVGEQAEVLDWSYKIKLRLCCVKDAIPAPILSEQYLDRADLTEGDFSKL